MPPELLSDGILSMATDAWSFGEPCLLLLPAVHDFSADACAFRTRVQTAVAAPHQITLTPDNATAPLACPLLPHRWHAAAERWHTKRACSVHTSTAFQFNVCVA